MKIKKINTQAKKNGRRDGKNEIPRADWKSNSVPYLTQLQKHFIVAINELIQLHENKKNKLINSKASLESQLMRLNADADLNQIELDDAGKKTIDKKSELDGPIEEAPVSRFARTRLLSVYLYLPILFFIGIAEYVITVPALQFLLGERGATAALAAFCISVASVGFAHVFGGALKERMNRAKPQTGIATIIPAVLVTLMTLTILYLSYIRGAYVNETAGNLNQIDSEMRVWFLTGLYTVMQAMFISLGTYLAFLHHSEVESKYFRAIAVRLYWNYISKKNLREIAKISSMLERVNRGLSNHDQQEKVILLSEIEKYQSLYEEACAIYRSANIHARKDELNGAHEALQELAIVATSDKATQNYSGKFQDSDFVRIEKIEETLSR